MAEDIAGVAIPDSALTREATELVRDVADDLVFHHSRRVYLWGSLQGTRRGLVPDPELLYIGAMFHDLGLTQKYGSTDQRFELDGADTARSFLLGHGFSEREARQVWLGIALHTTPGIPDRMEPEIALVTAGVETDVLGLGLDALNSSEIQEILAVHPRVNFADGILNAFNEGMRHRPETTFGTMNDDVLAHFDPDFRRGNFVGLITSNALPG
ncbi:HD domain-containing protein [Mycolicibacterium smegmatis]|uniref:HD domain-containing protein n=1 Tax=Mycolicibacterium smegmatis TaxID=1772 RepID=UPI0005D9D108|nr:HD domain-containing protein [Mycolicibacterium smegmatis]MCP2625244.1 HD domain-containing protein [Mycolicibacterium smegmatis]MDF1899232.1 HD domain-containing protein [Mycolicibacterium smegmatis]MDF1904644.1 HD domain-containing protein [Mycolicibacterium smegmatis]MDF1918513.1 HD domain-containing protein [Mycolicibacterium smegmatis]MDF1923808.1 HD domain-containing protein [Mycolicibacterium smegmatis]